MAKRYKKPKWPEGNFALVDDSGMPDGPHHRDEFGHNGNNEYVKSGYGGHPVFLRIVRQQGNEIWSEDGGGKVWHYTLAPFDG